MESLRKWLAIFLFLPTLAIAYDDEEPLSTAVDMARWCKETTFSDLARSNDRLFNWTHSIHAKGNTYVVRGHWRVNDEDVYVECKSRIGAPRKYATYRVMGKDEY